MMRASTTGSLRQALSHTTPCFDFADSFADAQDEEAEEDACRGRLRAAEDASVQALLHELCQRPESNIAVVCHGGVIKSLCAAHPSITRGEVKNCELVRCVLDPKTGVLSLDGKKPRVVVAPKEDPGRL